MRLKQVLSQGRACRGYLEKRTLLGARTTWRGFLEAVVYEGPGGSLRSPGSWLAPGAVEISPVSSSAEWGQARPPAGGCQWGYVTKPSTPARCAPRSLSAEEAKRPQSGRGAALGPAAKAGPALSAATADPAPWTPTAPSSFLHVG